MHPETSVSFFYTFTQKLQMTAYQIHITGKVQGVWFRKYTQEKALQFGIKGCVRNQPDGSVYVEAEGEHAAMDDFVRWLHKGSPLSEVKDVQIQSVEPAGYTGFEIKR